MFPEGKVPVEFVKHVVQRLLGCVNWLFCDCDVIHTEVTATNVLLSVNDESSLQRIEEAEATNPSKPSNVNGYPIYPSRGEPISMLELNLDPVLTDFGSSRSAAAVNKDWWMPDTHRAPEVLMGLPWDAQVDVWSIGVMASRAIIFNQIKSLLTIRRLLNSSKVETSSILSTKPTTNTYSLWHWRST